MNQKKVKNVLEKAKGAGAGKAKGREATGPKCIPELVGRHLVVEQKQNPDWARKLKAVVRPRPEDKDAFDFRVFDEAQAAAKKVTIKDYSSLDEYPDLIVYEGWFDKKAMKVQMEEKKSPGVIGKWRL